MKPINSHPALASQEGAKVACGTRHFEALEVGESAAKYEVARTLSDLLARI